MSDPLAVLRDAATIRQRCRAIARAVSDGRSGWFSIDRSALGAAADRVAALTRERFPDLDIPYHSRWRHFEAGGVDRKSRLDEALAAADDDERLRARIDLTVVSVLLDAGAGAAWRYEEGGRTYARSEGLGVASLRAFMAGAFAADRAAPCRVDGEALCAVDAAALRTAFQVTPANALVGLEGRAALLVRLGRALLAARVQSGGSARPSRVVDALLAGGVREVPAGALLGALLRGFADIWRSGSIVAGVPAGDVWPHRFAGSETAGGHDSTSAGWVPFHKLTQWLAYSLLEPLQWAGVTVTGLDALTGLPEYRNGGLLLDAGVIVPRRASDLTRRWKPGDEFVVEWRALTVVLLDELAEQVRQRLDRNAADMPLACILEGGTWAAGRQIAAEKREGGGPPLLIDSDGTLF